ncbi:MAG: hypothetical protein U5R30_04745 [Deltaproteobacteria bacterium]|nr:hypothetical protein [Deltaproteobacteria bacterium]
MILTALKEQIKNGAKSLVGNKGYRKYLTIAKDSVSIDEEKVRNESRFDGKWVLATNTKMSAEKVALNYKELWQVEKVFRDIKSLLNTRPIFHQRDRTIRGHVFCTFLAPRFAKSLNGKLKSSRSRPGVGRHQAGPKGNSASDHRRKRQANGDQKQVRGRVRQSFSGSRCCHAANNKRTLAHDRQ